MTLPSSSATSATSATASARRDPTAIAPPETIAPYIREIGRGKDGARSLTREQADDLMTRLYTGRLADLEVGGFALAMRIKGETPEELLGFVAATMRHVMPLPAADRPVLLASYNGARRLPNLTPLLAVLLARAGVPVLVHGLRKDPGRVTSAEVFEALGMPACTSAADVAARFAAGEPAFVPTDVLCPPLARLLAIRRVLGLRNSGHTVAKILPLWPAALRVVNHTHPEYSDSLTQTLQASGADAVLMRGTEGEPVADARRLQALAVFLAGAAVPELSRPTEEGSLRAVPELPVAIDAGTTAETIRAMAAGRIAVPGPITAQAQCLRAVRERIAPR